MGFIQHLRDVIRFMQLPKEQRRLTFYSEGKNYWPHLEGLIRETLATSNIPICYFTSDVGDPGRLIQHPNYRAFKIDEGFVRNWLFENIETDVMVLTMPDLNQFQVKCSKHNVHYVYVQHSLVSLHMIYREGAFDHYDTIFCAGPHHIKEIRAMEAHYNLPRKHLVEHGYGRLDTIINEEKKQQESKQLVNIPKHVLIAPSWGAKGTIESGLGEKVIDQLIEQDYQVTLRPHPQTIKLAKKRIAIILKKHNKNPLFTYEESVAGQQSLHDSDVMLSDWSGAALDYAFGLNKPVLFIDVPKKINNKNYEALKLKPLEIEIRTLIGGIMDTNDCARSLKQIFLSKNKISDIKTNYVFNIGESNSKGCLALIHLCSKRVK